MSADIRPIYCDFEQDDYCPISTESVICSEDIHLVSANNSMRISDASLNRSKLVAFHKDYIILRRFKLRQRTQTF